MPDHQDVADAQYARASRLLRRHARYLTGDTGLGNAIAASTMQVMAGSPPRQNRNEPAQISYLRAAHHLHPQLSDTSEMLARSVLTLDVIERCSKMQIADILPSQIDEIDKIRALRDYRDPPNGCRVMLIEDEALLAMDLCQAITDRGNTIAGIARTRAEAIARAIQTKPELIVSDLTLADGSSGADAVAAISETFADIPVIILTAAADAVLTDNANDPAFILEKPHLPEQLPLMIALALRAPKKRPLLAGSRPGEIPNQEPDQG